MAQVLMSMEEYKQAERKLNILKELKETVRSSGVFEDNTSCWNTEKDIRRAFTIEETATLVKAILSL